MSKSKIESTTAVFIYDRDNNLLTAAIAEAVNVPNGVAFASTGYMSAEKAEARLQELKELSKDGHLGWLSSSTGRCRCFVIPPQTFPVGNLFQYLDAIEKIYFESHPEGPATINVKPNSTRS